MRRRGLGVGAIQQKKAMEAKYEQMSANLAKEKLEMLTQKMESFRDKLQDFAIKHKKEIQNNPEFRRAFQKMCADMGVDPLSSSMSFWNKMLGVGEIYYELAVQVVEICWALQHRTGGMMELDELYDRLLKNRSVSSKSKAEISRDDVIKSIEKMSKLGTGIRMVKCRDTYVIQSLSKELNLDQNEVVKLAQENDAKVTVKDLKEKFGWTQTRSEKTMDDLVMDGIVWIDEPGPGRCRIYWFPGFFKENL